MKLCTKCGSYICDCNNSSLYDSSKSSFSSINNQDRYDYFPKTGLDRPFGPSGLTERDHAAGLSFCGGW